MCISQHDPLSGKVQSASDDSPASLKQIASNLSAENAVLKARNEQLETNYKLAKCAAFIFTAESVEQMRVFPHDEMGEQRHALARRRQVVERAHRHVDFVCNPLNVEQELWRILLEQNAGKSADHRTCIFYAKSRRPPRIR